MPKPAVVASSKYKIFETNRFAKDLDDLALHRARHFEEKLRTYVYPQLSREPHWGPNIKRLKGWDPPTWRYRIGEWRFFYIISEDTKTVSMIAAAHRKEAYR
ncbi:MAG: type II toxin-antitoxin system RelE/ParE family toxin [Deltaproteobacteria bacterium]|nr:type II toxin-antitoxin system RelE/ParE family toxin [Deltaproteobacteria bacterium]